MRNRERSRVCAWASKWLDSSGAYSVRNPYVWVAHVSMKTEASVFCSRMPSVMASAIAMMEADIEYSAQRLPYMQDPNCKRVFEQNACVGVRFD